LTHIKAGAPRRFGQCVGHDTARVAMLALTEEMGRHHAACAQLVRAGEEAIERADWDAFAAVAAKLRDAFLRHFAFEEDELFPAFERASGLREFTRELCSQHDDLRAILEALVSVSPRHDPEGCADEFATLALLFRQHAAREEQAMYPALERTLGARAEAMVRASEEKDAAASEALDVRGLEPPEPMLRIMERLKSAPREPLRVRIHREPFPLYDLLSEQGFSWHARRLGECDFELVITRA
jgi:hemerythrin-like domain-containing protein